MAEMSPLRRRMTEDMTVRNLSPGTQRVRNTFRGHATMSSLPFDSGQCHPDPR